MSETYQYTTAFAELQQIVAEIEDGNISVDELSEKVKRAAALITVCKTKLTATEADVKAVLAALSTETNVGEGDEVSEDSAGEGEDAEECDIEEE